MAIKFQYNKTSLQQLEKQLKVRVRTLPIIKNKESALRMEVKRCTIFTVIRKWTKNVPKVEDASTAPRNRRRNSQNRLLLS